jgi:hypothetical protein
VSPVGNSTLRDFPSPVTVGIHVVKGIITDAFGNATEVTRNTFVDTTLAGWRTFYFATPDNTSVRADHMDADGDGLSNAFEFAAGLSPVSAASRFYPQLEPVTGQPGQKAITFGPIVGGRTYTVKCKNSLLDAEWLPLADFTTSDMGLERTVIDLSPGAGPRFYRVEITVP